MLKETTALSVLGGQLFCVLADLLHATRTLLQLGDYGKYFGQKHDVNVTIPSQTGLPKLLDSWVTPHVMLLWLSVFFNCTLDIISTIHSLGSRCRIGYQMKSSVNSDKSNRPSTHKSNNDVDCFGVNVLLTGGSNAPRPKTFAQNKSTTTENLRKIQGKSPTIIG